LQLADQRRIRGVPASRGPASQRSLATSPARQALLSAGLAEQARAIALEATTLEPKSAQAFSTPRPVLKHNLIGRLLKNGMDYDGAVAAYKKAIRALS